MKFNETPAQEILLNRLISEGYKWPEHSHSYTSRFGVATVTKKQFEARDGWIVWRDTFAQYFNNGDSIDIAYPDGVIVRNSIISKHGVDKWTSPEDLASCEELVYAVRLHRPEQPHAELKAQYEEDAKTHTEPWLLWEMALLDVWQRCHRHPEWDPSVKYRRNPKEPTKVYVVTDNNPSSYGFPSSFEAVFSTKEKAQAYVDRFGSHGQTFLDIQEEILDDECN